MLVKSKNARVIVFFFIRDHAKYAELLIGKMGIDGNDDVIFRPGFQIKSLIVTLDQGSINSI